MTRLALMIAGSALLAAPAAGQRSIPWQSDVKGGIARAQRTRLPLMFYVLGRSSDRSHDLERDQKRAFANPMVVEMSKRFIPVKLSRSRYPDLLAKWQVPRDANMWIVFATPEGDKLGVLDSPGATRPDSLLQKMGLTFRLYRQQMFDKELRPKLEDEKASASDLKRALKAIDAFMILGADQSVIKLLERRRLDQGVEKMCYDVLATLSSPASVSALLKRAADGEAQARAALARCTPAAAEQMLGQLGGQDRELHLIVYAAVTKICQIRKVKSARFWEGKNERLKAQEIERVEKLVRQVARRWKEQYEEYR